MTTRESSIQELTLSDLRTVVGGEDNSATQIASFARRAAESRVADNCIARFGTKDGSQAQILSCINTAGDQAFQRTMKQMAGVPVNPR